MKSNLRLIPSEHTPSSFLMLCQTEAVQCSGSQDLEREVQAPSQLSERVLWSLCHSVVYSCT